MPFKHKPVRWADLSQKHEHQKVAMMGIGQIEAEMILHEHAHRPIEGRILSVGRQNILPTGAEVLDLLKEREIKCLNPEFQKNVHDTHGAGNDEAISDESFFGAFSTANYEVADISPYEAADYIFDICQGVPDDMIGQFDFIVDGGSLDNVFDPLSMLRNMAKMLKPDGRMFIWAWSEMFPSAYVKITPDFILDYCAVNEFADAKVYVSTCDMIEHQLSTEEGADIFHFEPYQETFHGPACMPAYASTGSYSSTYCMAEKGKDSTTDRLAVQQVYRGSDIEPYLSATRRFSKSDRPLFHRPNGPEVLNEPPTKQPTLKPVARFGPEKAPTFEKEVSDIVYSTRNDLGILASRVEILISGQASLQAQLASVMAELATLKDKP